MKTMGGTKCSVPPEFLGVRYNSGSCEPESKLLNWNYIEDYTGEYSSAC